MTVDVIAGVPSLKYKTGCGNCIQLSSKYKNDISQYVINRKLKYYPKNIKIVGLSNWISNVARDSKVFKSFDIRVINNNINCDIFYPVDKILARKKLGIETNKKIILTGALLNESVYKGFSKFIQSLNFIDYETNYLIFFGDMDEKDVSSTNFEYKDYGYIKDKNLLRLIYSAADVFVAPSIMDTFPKTLMESMACGTPVVCFDATGPKDIVDHKLNGYRAKPYNICDLANGVNWITKHPIPQELSTNARIKAKSVFDSKVVAQEHLKLYKEITDKL